MCTFNFEEKVDSQKNTMEKLNENQFADDITIQNNKPSTINLDQPIINNLESIHKTNVEIKLEYCEMNKDDEMMIDDKQQPEPNVNIECEEQSQENRKNVTIGQIIHDSNDNFSKSQTENIQSINDRVLENAHHPNQDVKMISESEFINNEILNKEEDLLDYFLCFLDSDQPLNYVLCGYFSRFFESLFNKNPTYVWNLLNK